VDGADVGAAKRQLWADLVKTVVAPKLTGVAKRTRGDIVVRPADEATYVVLKALKKEGKGVKEECVK